MGDCPDCGCPTLPPDEPKRPNEYDHAHGCPRGPSKAQMRVLRAAAGREGGFICPTPGLRGGAQTTVLDALERQGYAARDPRPAHAPPPPAFWYCPLRITEAGRVIVEADALLSSSVAPKEGE